MKFSSPNALCRQKEVVDESFPGDIVGLHDTGSFRIGDTLTAGENYSSKEFWVSHQNISVISIMMIH